MKKIIACLFALALIVSPRFVFAADNKGLHLGGLEKDAKKAKIEAKKDAQQAEKDAKAAKRKAEKDAEKKKKEAEKAKKKSQKDAERKSKEAQEKLGKMKK